MHIQRLHLSHRVGPRLLLVLIALGLVVPTRASDTPPPDGVTIAGSLQSELGCSGDWQPDCAAQPARLRRGRRGLAGHASRCPAGSYEYKAALNDSWDENYGANAQRERSQHPAEPRRRGGGQVLLRPRDALGHEQRELGHRHGAGQLPERARLPGRLAAGLPALLAAGPRRRRHLHLRDQRPCRPAPTRSRSRSTRAGTRTTARTACRAVPTSRSPCRRPATSMTFSYDPTTHVLTVTRRHRRAAARKRDHRRAASRASSAAPGDWQPDCAATHLAFDADDGVWQGDLHRAGGQLRVQGGAQRRLGRELRRDATRNGPNIGLSLAARRAVKFYYDHATPLGHEQPRTR